MHTDLESRGNKQPDPVAEWVEKTASTIARKRADEVLGEAERLLVASGQMTRDISYKYQAFWHAVFDEFHKSAKTKCLEKVAEIAERLISAEEEVSV